MRRNWAVYVGIAVGAALLIAGLWWALGPLERSPLGGGRDWGLHFYPATVRFLTRQDPYAVPGVYNPPWLFLSLAPLAPFPERLAWVLLALGTMALTVATARLFGEKRLSGLVLAATSPYLLTTMLQGQVDGVALAGLFVAAIWWDRGGGAGWMGAALLLLTAKPQAALLALAVVLLHLFSGPRRRWAIAALVAGAGVLLSSAWAGWDWPWRILQNLRTLPPLPLPRVDAWIVLNSAGLAHPEWVLLPAAGGILAVLAWTFHREGWSQRLLALAVVGGLLVTPYLSGPSLLLGTAAALPWLAGRRRWWAALPAYALAWAGSFLRWEPALHALGADLWATLVLFVGLLVP